MKAAFCTTTVAEARSPSPADAGLDDLPWELGANPADSNKDGRCSRRNGRSEGKKEIDKIHRDLLAAMQFARENGAKDIVLIGASMGGTASLFVASQNPVSGVIAISAPIGFNGIEAGEVGNIRCAKLFIAGEEDGSAARSAQYLYENSTEPKKLVTYPTGLHGTDIFISGTYGEMLSNEILDFIAANVTGSNSMPHAASLPVRDGEGHPKVSLPRQCRKVP